MTGIEKLLETAKAVKAAREHDLISFGKYLLSMERHIRVKGSAVEQLGEPITDSDQLAIDDMVERKRREVSDADLANWTAK